MSAPAPTITGPGTVWGPCPVCDAWQVELPDGVLPLFEGLAAIEEAAREHFAAEHPEVLRAVTAKPPVTWKRPDTRHVRRIVERAIAERLGPGNRPRVAVERVDRGVLVTCNSGGNAGAAQQALSGRGYICEWSSRMPLASLLVLDPLPGRPQ